ncbi:hypothetical protein AvCA_27020 [Azotobacter vinelandii CA]|uniref:Uncharacterized protein n=3 Tax=Azotobacter group TaxID=351 RepID=C1DJV7_AZOVD|nr:hypothetical protein Avin_27020 [Azotobacter vinelandii DJ]AGK14871.1 hypothetical protein AvCA_27020 [Azotobacter vinelandii CA]AGK20822.1 hypothetical protein AvCA6_27020 [Azotobacter vinelandii CA6]
MAMNNFELEVEIAQVITQDGTVVLRLSSQDNVHDLYIHPSSARELGLCLIQAAESTVTDPSLLQLFDNWKKASGE